MRIWFSGPRVMGIRPGVSFGREDLAALARASNGKPPLLLRIAAFVVLLIALPVFAGAVWLLVTILKNLDWSAFPR